MNSFKQIPFILYSVLQICIAVNTSLSFKKFFIYIYKKKLFISIHITTFLLHGKENIWNFVKDLSSIFDPFSIVVPLFLWFCYVLEFDFRVFVSSLVLNLMKWLYLLGSACFNGSIRKTLNTENKKVLGKLF